MLRRFWCVLPAAACAAVGLSSAATASDEATGPSTLRPPPLTVSHAGQTVHATLGTYSWTTSTSDGAGSGVSADARYPLRTRGRLHVRSRSRIRLHTHDPARSVQASLVRRRGHRFRRVGEIRGERAIGSDGQQWSLRLPRRLHHANVLDVSVRYPQGDADFWAGITTRPLRVPQVTGTLRNAYRRLRRRGLRVRITHAFSSASLCTSSPTRQSPRSGRAVRPGSVVTLRGLMCGLGSPAVPVDPPSAQVPDFVGRRVSAAVHWAEDHGLYWQVEHLPALAAGDERELFANYLVTDQEPAAGSILTLGVGERHGSSGSFRPTPLTVHGRLLGECPRTSRHPLISRRPAALETLVPEGADGLQLCRYHGVGSPSSQAGELARSHVVRHRRAIRQLTRLFDDLPPGSAGPTACPNDDGTELIALFTYRGGLPVPVTIHTSGCRDATNGQLARSALEPPGPALLHRLQAATGPGRPAAGTRVEGAHPTKTS